MNRRILLGFAEKELLEMRRNRPGLSASAFAASVLLFLGLALNGPHRSAILLEFVYLMPLILVGVFFTDCIHMEVKALWLLRSILPSTSGLLQAKYAVMLAGMVPISVALACPAARMMPGADLRSVLVRTALASGATLLLSAFCLGLASSFTSLEDVPDRLTLDGRLWILGAYWCFGPVIPVLAWLFDRILLGGSNGLWWVVSADALAVLTLGTTLVLNAYGARRLTTFE